MEAVMKKVVIPAERAARGPESIHAMLSVSRGSWLWIPGSALRAAPE